jgi:hypothetical protein
MQPSTLAPGTRKPAQWWVLVTALAGALGALVAIAGGGKGTYNVAPFELEMRAFPAAQGKTEFAIKQVGELAPGHAEAGTHRSPIVFRVTIVGLASDLAPSDLADIRTPRAFADKIASDGKSAARSFGLKLGMLAITGSLAAGGVCSLFGRRWRRMVGALLAGVLTFGVIGLLVQQTYDKGEFLKTRFVLESEPTVPGLPGTTPIPTL